MRSFNSLQTGKPIQTHSEFDLHKILILLVSIPFKRESPSKLYLFGSSGAVASHTPKPNTNCAPIFYGKNRMPKRHNLPPTLIQTRFFNKTRRKPRPSLAFGAICAKFSPGEPAVFGCCFSILQIGRNVKFFAQKSQGQSIKRRTIN